jgi:hypothetical protein
MQSGWGGEIGRIRQGGTQPLQRLLHGVRRVVNGRDGDKPGQQNGITAGMLIAPGPRQANG